MKVLQVARYGSIKGGAETYIASLSAGLRDAGHEVVLAYGIDPDPARAEVAGGIHVPGLVDGDGSPDALARAIEDVSPDVVHVHVPDIAWAAPTAAAVRPTVLGVHDHVLDCPVGTRYWTTWKKACTVRPGPWCLAYNVAAHCGSLRANVTLRPYRRWRAAHRAARGLRLQVFSEHMRDALGHAGLDADEVTVTPYPVPPRAEPRRPEQLPPEDPDPRPVILAPGRLTKEKGFMQLVEAMERVRTPAHLVIAGAGHERPALERRVRQIGVRHRVSFTGWLRPSGMTWWMERAAMVALPSMWPEPFGIAGVEAMAAGRAVVAFDTGGIGEWLTDEVGVSVPAGDVPRLADALGALLDDEAARERMGAAGAARAARTFALGDHVERVLAMYRGAGA